MSIAKSASGYQFLRLLLTSRLLCAVCAIQGKSLGPVARGGENDGAAVVHQWQCLLNGEIDARVGIEGFVEMLSGDVASSLESLRNPRWQRRCQFCVFGRPRSGRGCRSSNFDASVSTLLTFFPIVVIARSSSCRLHPGIKTCSPSSTNCFAVARPIPLLPPVITPTFPVSFFDMVRSLSKKIGGRSAGEEFKRLAMSWRVPLR
jgi:hypothetical protein